MRRSVHASSAVAPERSTLGPILIDESNIKLRIPPLVEAQAALDTHKATRPAMGAFATFAGWEAAMQPWLAEKDRLLMTLELSKGRDLGVWKPVDAQRAQAEREARQKALPTPKPVPAIPQVSNPQPERKKEAPMPRLKAEDPHARAMQIVTDILKSVEKANGPDPDEARRASARYYERRGTLARHCKACKIPMPPVPPLRVNKDLTSAPQVPPLAVAGGARAAA